MCFGETGLRALSARSPARVGLGNFLYLLEVPKVVFVMDVCVKPACYDSVPPCLCKKCQMYDFKMSSRPVAKPN